MYLFCFSEIGFVIYYFPTSGLPRKYKTWFYGRLTDMELNRSFWYVYSMWSNSDLNPLPILQPLRFYCFHFQEITALNRERKSLAFAIPDGAAAAD